MKRLILVAILTLSFSGLVSAQDIVNLRMDRQQLDLRGAVATLDEDILIRKEYFREDWPERKWFVQDLRNVLREEQGRIMTFNPTGRITSITYTDQGRQGNKTTCTYASNGLLSSYVGEGYKVEAKYKGNVANINVFVETKDYAKSINLAKADLNNAPYKNVYPFDLKCIQEISGEGLVLQSRYYYVDSMPAKVCSYNYDINKHLLEEKITDYSRSVDGEQTLIRYTYDNQGYLIKKSVNAKAIDETYTFVNNELGDCISMTIERPYGTTVYTFKYEYDTNDNWTVRLQFQDGKFDNAALRTLTYHKVKTKEVKTNDAIDRKASAKEDKEAAKAAEKQRKKEIKENNKKSKAESKTEKEKKHKVKEDKKKNSDKQATTSKEEKKKQKAAEKEHIKQEKEKAKAAQKEEKERAKAAQKAEKEKLKQMSKEERKAYEKQKAETEKALKQQAKEEKIAAQNRQKAEKQRIKEQQKREKELLKAQKQAEKEQAKAQKQAEKEQAKQEKAAKQAAKKSETKAKKK